MNANLTQRQLDAICDAIDAHMATNPVTAANVERYNTLIEARGVLSGVRLAPDPRRITVRHLKQEARC